MPWQVEPAGTHEGAVGVTVTARRGSDTQETEKGDRAQTDD